MRRCHPRIPDRWLMTDARLGDDLWAALRRLPRGSGVVFRDYHLPERERRARFARVRRIACARGLVVVRAGSTRMRGEAGVHGAHPYRGHRLRTMPVHSRREAIAALRLGADALFVSPVFQTRSHPNARALGPVRLGLLIRGIEVPVVALGGMSDTALRRLRPLGITRYAAIDAWLRSGTPSRHRPPGCRAADPAG